MESQKVARKQARKEGKMIIEKQMQTERGIIYVKESFDCDVAATKAGYKECFYSSELDTVVFSRYIDMYHREFAIIE